jgi:hypothetical protein
MNHLNHSTGLCFISSSRLPNNDDWSFAIYSNGALEENYGWGYVGQIIHADLNPIDGMVHTVWVEVVNDAEDKDEVLRTIRGLCSEHIARYGGCLVEFVPFDSEVASWFQSGMPEPEPVPEMAWATTTEPEELPA